MNHAKNLTRIVWHYNHGDRREAIEYARAAGYRVDAEACQGYDEVRFHYEGRVHGLMHDHHGPDSEAFLFLFTPEATASGWSQFWWRLKHPFSPLRDLPWPNREAV